MNQLKKNKSCNTRVLLTSAFVTRNQQFLLYQEIQTKNEI